MKLNPITINLFNELRRNRLAITFDEITFEDKPSSIHPLDVKLNGKITKNISLKNPIVSSPMDTVTERELALAMAKCGGVGIIHRNMSAERQADMVDWVRNKIHSGAMIENPIKFYDHQNLSVLLASVKKNGWTFTNFPILNTSGLLVGMVSRNELEFVESDDPLLCDIMIPLNNLVVTKQLDVENAYNVMKFHMVKKLPVIDSDGMFVGLFTWNDIKSYERNNFSLDDEGHFLVGASIGVGVNDRRRVDLLQSVGCKILVIDTSHGACDQVIEMLNYVKDKHSSMEVIVGNIASYDSAMMLLKNRHKPDGFRVGISVGSICTTRRVTGHGIPQLTAIYNVQSAISEMGDNIPIIADGGIRCSGDCVKAFAVGASAIMMGGVFSATMESPSKLIIQDGNKYKMVRGMGSRSAMEERSGSRDRYFVKDKVKIVPEGVEGLVSYRGSVQSVMMEFNHGIKAGFAHSGAVDMAEFRANCTIWRQTVAGINEANPHSLVKLL